MKYRISLLVMAVVCGGSESSATEMAWLEVDTLESRLAGSDHNEVPVSELLPEGRILCAVGSYAFDLPEGYDTAKEDLENTGLLPVAEGNGLLFSVDEKRHLHSAFALSVWPDTVILDVAEPLCIPAASTQIDLRKDTRSLIIKLERRE